MHHSDNPFAKDRAFVVSVVCAAVEGVLAGGNFVLLLQALRQAFADQVDVTALLGLTGLLALVFAARLGVYAYGYTQGQLGGATVGRNVRLALGDKIRHIPMSRFTQRQSGEYLNALTASVDDYKKILTHKVGDLAKDAALSVMLVGFACWLFLPAGLILGAAMALLVPALALTLRQVRRYGQAKSEIGMRTVSAVVEHVDGMQTLRAYGMGDTRNESVTSGLRDHSEISFTYEAKIIPIGVVFSIVNGLSLPAVLVVGGNAWLAGEVDTVSFLLVAMLPLFGCKLAGTLFVNLTSYRNLLIARRHIDRILAEPEEPGTEKPFAPTGHDIELAHVDFSYQPGLPVLRGLDLACGSGELTALVGASGSGKTTVLNLIAKYYEPSAGTVMIGGQDIAGHAAEQVLHGVSIVEQNVFLFNDTVRDNVRYARPDASDADVEQACRLANADGFIRDLEHGYDTMIGENGNRLSGGERQRLSIARAILRDAPILLLDEATASLDIDNELAVKQAIVNLLARRTTVVMVAHTLSIVRDADRIVVLDGGRVVEQGTHEHLLGQAGAYASMWESHRRVTG